MRRILRGEDGNYHVGDKSFPNLIGSRQQVGHQTAYKTPGGLTIDGLIQTKDGRWRSRKKHFSAKSDNRLVKSGWGTRKGVFGSFKMGENKSRKSRRRRKP